MPASHSHSLIAEHDAAAVRPRTVFPQEHALPCAEAEASIDKGDHFRGTGQRHLNMAGHIVGAFVSVGKVGIVLRHQAIDKALEIAPRRRIGVFHNHQTAAGVAAKHRDGALSQAGRAQARSDDLSKLFGRFPRGGDLNLLGKSRHD